MSAATRPYIGRTAMSLTSSVMFVVAGIALLTAVVVPIRRLSEAGGEVVVSPVVQPGDGTMGVAGLPENVSLVPASGDALLSVGFLPADLRALTELPTALTALAVAVGVWLLARVVSSIEAGRPFDRRNPRRLAGIAVAVVLGGVVAPLSQSIVSTAVLEHLGLTGPGSPLALLSTTVSFAPVGIALALLVAAEAFRRGAGLAAEVEGMV